MTTFDYDGNSNRTKQTSPEGRVTQWNFDAANRQTSVVNGFGTAQAVTTQMFYDAAGNNTRIRDGRSNDTILTYQTWNLPEARIEPATIVSQPVVDRQWRRSYTAAGDVSKEEMPGTVRIDRTFDNAGRTLTEVGTGATGSRTFAYDAGGRTTSISHPNATIGVSYEDRGMILQTTGGPQALGVADTTYTYDNARRLTQRVDAIGTTTFDYDDADRLADTYDPLTGGHTQSWWDDANRNKGRAIVGPGMSGTSPAWYRGTDDYGRIVVEGHANAADDTLIQKYYTHDADSNITSEYVEGLASPTDAGNHTYTYDSLNRLTSWTAPGASAINYAYDGAGNRTQAGALTFVYDAQNHLTSGAGTTYTWSLRGTMATSLTSGVTTTSTFDVFGLPTAQGSTSYTYDGLGRVAKRNGTQTFAYPGVSKDPVSDGTWKMAMNASNEASAIKQGANPATFVGEDQHHDIVALIALNSNNSAGYQAFDPFGVRTSGTGTQPSIGYQSDWTDPTTSDVWMGARFYRPGADTFTSRDTFDGALNDPISLNRYTYASDNPTNAWDPTGNLTRAREGEFLQYICRSRDGSVVICGSAGAREHSSNRRCSQMA